MESQPIETTEMIQCDGQQGEIPSVDLSPLEFRCFICSKSFTKEHPYFAHLRQHKAQMPFPCPEPSCHRGFNRRNFLQEHAKEHEGNAMKWFHCDQENCHKAYRHKGTLVMHQRKCHQLGPELALHICEFCGRAFKSLTSLNDHRYTHKDKSEMPFACKETDCSRRFPTREKLKVHMMRHKGIKNFACPYCDMRKTTRNELKIHINYHTLERTWPCRFCSKVCNSSGNLKMHVRTVHERARDFPCSYCDKRFAKPDTRKYHEMTHTGEKNFECEECGKRFTQPAALRTHRRIHQRKKESAEAIVLPATEAIVLPAAEAIVLPAPEAIVLPVAEAIIVPAVTLLPPTILYVAI
ncbi:gastrula zinc finger protein XlCGF46.1 [Drosophila tropicalis]|uniref:gastrula zinc finger protein XlCGF46.1 n=1 Tax=Drosophila tropicalis TaxID=46794 RepID=UPI0035ABC888